MILGPKELLKLVKSKKIVENLSERELTNPEGAGFDLRLGEVYKISGSAFLGEIHRKTAEIELIAKYDRHSVKRPKEVHPESEILKPASPAKRGEQVQNDKKDSGLAFAALNAASFARMTDNNSLILKPGDFFLVKTIETVNMPQNLTASITPRSTTYRSGLFIRTGNVPPGYCGGLTFGLKNEGPIKVEIEMGARFVHIQFSEVKGGGNMYRGQWQGGRVTTRKKEKQV